MKPTDRLNPGLVAWFREYDEYHRHPLNRLTHKLAIPLIVFHVVAMFGWLHLASLGGFDLNAGHLVLLASLAFYLPLSPLYAVLMLLAGLGSLFLSQRLEATLGLQQARVVIVGIAVFAWIVQLAGHTVWEKRSPAFTKNLLQALVGPIYFLALVLGHWQAPAWNEQRATAP